VQSPCGADSRGSDFDSCVCDGGAGGGAARSCGWLMGGGDALLAQLCIRHSLWMLSSDQDFQRIASRCALRLWQA